MTNLPSFVVEAYDRTHPSDISDPSKVVVLQIEKSLEFCFPAPAPQSGSERPLKFADKAVSVAFFHIFNQLPLHVDSQAVLGAHAAGLLRLPSNVGFLFSKRGTIVYEY